MTACFALMVGPQGRAVGVEHIPELASSSIENIKKSAAASLLKEGSLSVHVGGMFPETQGYTFEIETKKKKIIFLLKLNEKIVYHPD